MLSASESVLEAVLPSRLSQHRAVLKEPGERCGFKPQRQLIEPSTLQYPPALPSHHPWRSTERTPKLLLLICRLALNKPRRISQLLSSAHLSCTASASTDPGSTAQLPCGHCSSVCCLPLLLSHLPQRAESLHETVFAPQSRVAATGTQGSRKKECWFSCCCTDQLTLQQWKHLQ